ncbi:MAG: hypothetical protein H7A25_26520, partial [Leptospiraceae bacterium]|nr:hypothetical protein [Leptospiraceae bacterium]
MKLARNLIIFIFITFGTIQCTSWPSLIFMLLGGGGGKGGIIFLPPGNSPSSTEAGKDSTSPLVPSTGTGTGTNTGTGTGNDTNTPTGTGTGSDTTTPTGTGTGTPTGQTASIPAIQSSSTKQGSGSYTVGSLLEIELHFSEPVQVSGTPSIKLNNGQTVSYSSGSGTNSLIFSYTVASLDDIVGLDLSSSSSLSLNGGSIKNLDSSLDASLSVPSPGSANSISGQENIIIDTLPPTISNISSTNINGSYGQGSKVNIQLTFTEAVTVNNNSGTPFLTLNTSPTIANASYVSGSGTNTLFFTYIVSNGENSSDLDVTSLILNGSSIVDEAGNNVLLSPFPSGGSNSLSYNHNILINTIVPGISFLSGSSSGLESVSSVSLEVKLSEASLIETSVVFSVSAGTASGNGIDYTLNSGTLTFQPGETSKTITFSVIDDSIYETNETIVISLSSFSNLAPGNFIDHTYSILNNDPAPEISFMLPSSNGSESVNTVMIPVNVMGNTALGSNVSYTISGGSATGSGTDYTLSSGTLLFNPGETSKNIVLAITNDTLSELDETIEITLSNPNNASLGANTAFTYTINDNDAPLLAFDSTSASDSEANTSVNIPVSLTGPQSASVTVNYSVTAGTASGSGTDYTLRDGTLTFSAGETTKNITLAITNDTLSELDETIEITLSNPTNASLGANTAFTYTIQDNDAPLLAFDSTSASGSEATTSVNIPVSLSGPQSASVTVNYSVTAGTASGSGTDYTLSDGTLTFSAGETTKNITLAITNDTLSELDETIEITLSNPNNASLGVNTAFTYTIQDNDAPQLAFDSSSASGSEATTSVNIPVSLTGPQSASVTVNYSVTAGTASGSGTDYTLSDGTLTFSAGETTKNIVLAITNDTLSELDETIEITLSNPNNASLGANTAFTYTIQDNDAPLLAFDSTSASGSEATVSVNIPVSLSGPQSGAISIDYAISGGSATGSGTDYTLSSGTLLFNPGET